MKLLNKITIWFIIIVLLLTPISMYISFNNIKKEIDKEETERMISLNAKVAQQIQAGNPVTYYTSVYYVSITKIIGGLPEKTVQVNESSLYNADLNRNENLLTVDSYYLINKINYKISSRTYMAKSDDILTGMMHTLFWKVLITILGLSITARLLSLKLLSSFRQTIRAINQFNLKKKEKIHLYKTNIKEFKELNDFLQRMTDKAIEDYSSVKEFSENASHELQTPVAILRSKLELLTETNIDSSQAALMADMQNALDKLSSITRSLTLLTRLENQEYDKTKNVSFFKITNDVIAAFDEWIKAKQINVYKELDKNIFLTVNPALAEILLSNLISNAIRHNVEGGHIYIHLQSSMLQISNTGNEPVIPVKELFKRFKKGNQCSNSIGLGLAIVKQICDVSNFNINYYYNNGWHTLVVSFTNTPQIPLSIPDSIFQYS